jgi:hypothetical protein
MTRYGPKLERRQAVLFRLVDIGAELYAMCASCVKASALVEERPNDDSPIHVADLFCRQARKRVEALFDGLFSDADRPAYRVAQQVLEGEYRWLEQGIFAPPAPEGIER